MPRWRANLQSLRTQLILWAILPVILVIIVVAFTGVYAHQQAMHDFVASRNAVLAQLLADGIEADLRNGRIHADGSNIILPETGESTSLTIADSTGAVLAHSDASLADDHVHATLDLTTWTQTTPTSFEIEGDGVMYLVTVVRVTGTDWFVIVQEAVDDLLGPVLRYSSLGPTVAVLAVGLSILILTFAWRTIVNPLQQLSQASEQVSWGNHNALDAELQGVTEIRELHRVLLTMVERIESYENSIRDYIEEITTAQESERAHLARELHDGPLQSLIALGHRMEMAQQALDHDDIAAAKANILALREAQAGIIQEVRRAMSALRPLYLEDLGLEPALRMLAQSLAQDGVEIVCDLSQPPVRYCDPVELAAYRIAQESINNAVQHGQASHIQLRADYTPQGLTLTVTDDGIGFNPEPHFDVYTQAGHFGLVGMRERVRQLDGDFRVLSSPGEGTTVRVYLPATSFSDGRNLTPG